METIVAVINSQGIIQNRAQTNIEILTEEGFLILNRVKTELTPHQARIIATTHAQSQGKQVTPADIALYTDGPCIILLLRRKEVIHTLTVNALRLDFFYFSPTLWCALRDMELLFPSEPLLERVVVVIKPEYTQEQYTQIMETFENNDFVLLGKSPRILGQEVVTRLFRSDLTEDIAYLTSDVSVSLVLERIGAITSMHLLLGPSDPQEAQKYASHTIRARFGKDRIHNCIYASENENQSKHDANLLFPAPFVIERTLAIIKPDLYAQADKILDIIALNGFTVIAKDTFTHSKQRAEQLYAEHAGKSHYDELITYMSSGPLMALVLAKPGAIDAWRKLIGPTSPDVARQQKPNSLRARLGYDTYHNGLHGSNNEWIANQEIQAYFPMIPIEHIPNHEEIIQILSAKPQTRPFGAPQKSLNDVLVEGLTQLCRVKPVGTEAITWLADWLLRNNPNKPQVEEPVETKPLVSISSQLSSHAPNERISIIWLIGAPGTNKHSLSNQLGKTYNYEVIHATDVLNAAVKSNNTYSDIIREYQSTGRIVPTHITITLLKQAILGSGKTKFLISAFPLTLDESFAFESEICACHRIIYINTDTETLIQKAYAKQTTEIKNGNPVDRDLIHKRVSTFTENTTPVVEHYRLFNKLRSIDGNQSESNIVQELRTTFVV